MADRPSSRHHPGPASAAGMARPQVASRLRQERPHQRQEFVKDPSRACSGGVDNPPRARRRRHPVCPDRRLPGRPGGPSRHQRPRPWPAPTGRPAPDPDRMAAARTADQKPGEAGQPAGAAAEDLGAAVRRRDPLPPPVHGPAPTQAGTRPGTPPPPAHRAGHGLPVPALREPTMASRFTEEIDGEGVAWAAAGFVASLVIGRPGSRWCGGCDPPRGPSSSWSGSASPLVVSS
jgi:hypothetical protein